MAYTVKVDGIEVTASTPAEAAALVAELRKVQIATEGRSKSSEKSLQDFQGFGNGLSMTLTELNPATAGTALKFLKAIRAGSQSGGVQAEALMSVLAITAPKAIGSKSAAVNKVITNLGLKPKTVYINPRTAAGRIWKGGRNLDHAIQLLEQRLAAH